MPRILSLILTAFLAYVFYLGAIGEADLPPLQNGDIVFQTTWTNQSMATAMASLSLYLHTGIVEKTPEGDVVIEAGNVVRKTPLHKWIDGGILKRFAVYRYQGLTPEEGVDVVHAAEHYLGRKYDYYFSFGNDDIYCSELDYLAYKDSGLHLGIPEQIGTLHINNPFVKQLIKDRWKNYPQCKGKDLTFNQCYDVMMSGYLITPAAIARDPHLTRLFTNYP